MEIFDPIRFLTESRGIEISFVKEYIIGERYVVVILENGNLGLAANIINVKNFDFRKCKNFDFENTVHRLFLLAYFNAILNNVSGKFSEGDIFDIINFSEYKNIVMVGYSVPMYKKLTERNCIPYVFDNNSDADLVIKQNLMPEYLKNADSVILTGTSIINNTFTEIIEMLDTKCDVFLIGPSVPLSDIILNVRNIRGIFGTKFKTGDKNIISLIKQNEGTNCLKKYGKKLALLKKSN